MPRSLLANVMSIEVLKADGFVHIADVSRTSTPNLWAFGAISPVALEPHDSWVYVICVGKSIVKLGETNLPLFIPKVYDPTVPTANGGRLGRLARGAETDKNIRKALQGDEE